jgi:proteasome lid subunit RPN8/RPN11
VLTITRSMLAQMITEARAGHPLEICGIIAGVGNTALELRPMRNADPAPRVRYALDPHEQLAAFEAFDARGWNLLGIYHSHPAGPRYPSESDIAESYYPEAVYFIISLDGPDAPDVSAWQIIDGRAEAADWQVRPD